MDILGKRLTSKPKTPLAVIGPASSGPNKDAQAINKLSTFNVAQISYSATSPSLSDFSVYSTFLRTPPSDAYQAAYISKLIKFWQVRERRERRGGAQGVGVGMEGEGGGEDYIDRDRLIDLRKNVSTPAF